ncbi:DUF4259 domain-containing protein [Dactylosporangium sp. NPDC051485]|uniref:DUF4259 domain-containing protein n=1 Tax=Dactylosporangium sp. NPDC051485 TaxID=3154846 RepID=UPI00342A12FF
MGTWGSGNFDSDTAADHLSILTARLMREIEDAMAGDPVELEPDEYWGVAVPCNVEILCLLAGQPWVGVVLPAAETVEAWKATFLAAWDANIDGLEPTPEHKAARRAVLERTFDRLTEAIRAA